MPSKVSFKGNWDVTNDTANDVVNIQHDNGGQFQFVTDGVVQELNGGDGVSFKFDTNARTAKFVNADGTDAFVVNDGGPVEVLNANLSVSGNNVTSIKNLKMNHDNSRMHTNGSGTGSVGFHDIANGNTLLKANEGGPVEVLNANLRLGKSTKPNIEDSNGQRRTEFSGDTTYIMGDGSGTGSVNIYDEANGNDLLRVNEGGPVEVVNSQLNVLNDRIKMGPTQVVSWGKSDGTSTVDPYVESNTNDEIQATDGAGNTTTLT